MIPDELKRLHRMTGTERLGQNRDSEYLGAEDIDPDTEPVLTIKALYFGAVTLSNGKEEKEVIEFVESTVPGIKNVRPMVVNATCRKALKKLYKSTSAEVLEGKQIKLYVIPEGARNPRTGERVDCIRIKPEIPKATFSRDIICDECGGILTAYGKMNPAQLAAYTKKKYGKVMCADCAGQQAKAEQAEQTEKAATTEQNDTTPNESAEQHGTENSETNSNNETTATEE